MRIHLELTSDPLPCPATQQPNHPSGTWIPLAGFISGPGEAGSRNSASDLVETTSPRHRSPSSPSNLVETISPRHRSHSTPKLVEALSLSYHSSPRLIEVIPPSHHTRLGLKEVLFPSLKTTATQCLITSSCSHAHLVLTSYLKWDSSLQ